MDTAIDRINLPMQGCTDNYDCTLGSPGWRTPCQGKPHRGYPIRRGPSFELNKEAIRRSNPKYKGTFDPRPLYSCAVRGWPVKQTHLPLPEYGGPIPAQAAVLLVSEELSNEATTQRRPYALSHVEVVRTSQWPLKSSVESIKHFISFLLDQP